MATVDDYREASVPTSNELVRLAEAAERARWEKVVAGLVEALERFAGLECRRPSPARDCSTDPPVPREHWCRVCVARAALAAARELLGER